MYYTVYNYVGIKAVGRAHVRSAARAKKSYLFLLEAKRYRNSGYSEKFWWVVIW